MNRPQSNEYAPFYGKYIDTVSENVLGELEHQANSFHEFLNSIPEEKVLYAYAEGKWTVKELVGHVIDTERIMAYRALTFARGDANQLPGFEENDYVKKARFNDHTLSALANEFAALRRANVFLFRSFNGDDLNSMGVASGREISVRALLYIIAGHVNHHKNILNERYL